MLLWKSLNKHIGAEGVSQSDGKTSRIVDAPYTLQGLVPTSHTLRDTAVADIVGYIPF